LRKNNGKITLNDKIHKTLNQPVKQSSRQLLIRISFLSNYPFWCVCKIKSTL